MGVFIIRPKSGPDSKKYKQKYLSGQLSRRLQIFRIKRSDSQENSPKRNENQNYILSISGFQLTEWIPPALDVR